ncbi:SRPBCC family protein [Mesoterricola silvestris]|uniref:Polyketide cyclase n=1 Tax=Mesoterricola silvestris TaxID=2927979 RepID=A0AA48K8S2_9BACT|nr:SRPBCC family protein [Mesoterricola silvestris]BDU72636.1 hypothetical protein METEAL_18100 [Mesoterricola silvestris]
MVNWHAEHTLDTSAEPGDVWAKLEEVSAWPQWDTGITWAELSGPFSSGTRGRLEIRGEGRRVFRLARVEERSSFTALVKLPLAEIRHTHAQEACDLGTRMTHRIEITGPLSWFYALTRGRTLREGLAPGMRTLARMASARQS